MHLDDDRAVELLWELYQRSQSREFGKLVQKLLAIAFSRAGYSHIVERTVQGVDIDVARRLPGVAPTTPSAPHDGAAPSASEPPEHVGTGEPPALVYERYAIEVKTTVKSSIPLQEKDLRGLQDRAHDGYEPVLAVLRMDDYCELTFAHAGRLRPGPLSLLTLPAYRLRDLEDLIVPIFLAVVREHCRRAIEGGQYYLDSVLADLGVRVERS